MEAIQEYAPVALQIVGFLSIVATFTPTPVDDGVLAVLRRVLNAGAMNFGQSENLKKPGNK